jgi:ribosomal protein S18 acetylase RimI-like enzyme
MIFELMQEKDREVCIDLTARAFAQYDFFSIYFSNDKLRPHFLKTMLETEFKVNKDRAHFLVAKEEGKTIGLAMIREPDYQMPSEWAYLKAGFWKNLVMDGLKNVLAWHQMEKEAGTPCKNLHGSPWHLHLLAVDPAFSGKGIGSRMLQETVIPYIQKYGARRLSLYTNSHINSLFYQKNGFELFDYQEFSYKGKSFGNWSFVKDLTENENS